MSEDRLDEIKKKYYEDNSWRYAAWEVYGEDINWLFHEVERLREWQRTHDACDPIHWEGKIDSLTKERDELNKEIKRINNIKHGWAKKSRRIRAENAELKATIQEMSESHRRQQQRVGRGPEY